ncbi:hypothetical protein DVH24_005645 [Malus domestica]|uniref:Uncharacterized protein n=1 Tax=Malus domestica TaxID=3750 RepID=A0A498IN42_MALDO|nr:hypothetical protein DVH24_005645 [Malus domestica]
MSHLIKTRRAMTSSPNPTTTPTTAATAPAEMDHRPVNPVDLVSPPVPQAQASSTSSVVLPVSALCTHRHPHTTDQIFLHKFSSAFIIKRHARQKDNYEHAKIYSFVGARIHKDTETKSFTQILITYSSKSWLRIFTFHSTLRYAHKHKNRRRIEHFYLALRTKIIVMAVLRWDGSGCTSNMSYSYGGTAREQ